MPGSERKVRGKVQLSVNDKTEEDEISMTATSAESLAGASAHREELGHVFAQHVTDTSFDALSAGAVRAAKQSVLDTLGVMVGATGLSEVLTGVVAFERDQGGKEESTILGFGGKLPAVSAAFVNGAMAHALDFDDHLPEGHHPSSSLVPALFAVAERLGGVSGKEFITALALGQDFFTRMRKSVQWKQDWFITPVIGSFAAAAACGKLLGLNKRQIVDAFGIASCQSAGTMQLAYGTGGDLRGMYSGFAARAGVFSALLAESGVTGTDEPFEGQAGFLEVYFDGQWDEAAMLDGLGVEFQGETIIYKLWPSCGVTHGYIATALDLLGGPGRADEIESIEVLGGDFAQRLSEPLEKRRRPESVLDGKFSIPYTMALGIERGTIGVGDFSEEHRLDPEVGKITDKITFTRDSKFDWGAELPASEVRIKLTSGELLEGSTTHDELPGSGSNRLSWEQLAAKFADCANFSINPIATERIALVVEDSQNLENLDDATRIIRHLGG